MSDPQKEAKALEAKNAGNAALKAGKIDDAIKYFSAGLTYTPNNQVLFSNRSAAYASLGKYQEALADADEAIRCAPQWSKAYSRRGLALFKLSRAEDSVAAYKQGLAIDPNNAALKSGYEQAEALLKATEFCVLGEQFLTKKQYQAALEHFKKATELAPGKRLFWSNKSNVEMLIGRTTDAVASADKCIALAPTWHKGFQRKAEALAGAKRFKDALPLFAHAVSLAPDNTALSRAFGSCQQEAFNQDRRAAYEAAAKEKAKDDEPNAKAAKTDSNAKPQDKKK